MSKCEHGLTSKECYVCASPKYGDHGSMSNEPVTLWLWKNLVGGRPEYWAFDNAFPVHLDGGDPQTLGEPCGYALFKPSRKGRHDISDAEVLRRIGHPVDDTALLRQALEALEFFSDTSNSAMDKAMSEDAITALRERLGEKT